MTETADKNSFAQRARRYANVTSAVAQIGAKTLASQFVKSSKSDQAVLLARLAGSLKGPLMKIPQLLATVPDFLPAEYAAELLKLQSDAPAMGWPFVRRRMAAELGSEWQTKFKSFNQEASCAASLGQVHKAVLHDGSQVACKLQYSNMEATVEADLAQLKLVAGLFDTFDGALETQGTPYKEIAARIREELDYEREAKNMALYHDMLSNVPCVHVPLPVSELSTKRLLTMSWLDGEKMIEAAETRSLEDRNAIATAMFRLWYTPFYHFGVIHGDPHLGNYTVREDNSINLLDFGCIRVVRPQLLQAVIMLFHAFHQNNKAMEYEAYDLWGFKNVPRETLDVLGLWARFIYAPVLHDDTIPLDESHNTAKGREIAKKVHHELRRLGGVTIPPEFIMIDRASVGLGSVFLRLRAQVNWYRLFAELTQDFDVEVLAERQKTVLHKHGLTDLI